MRARILGRFGLRIACVAALAAPAERAAASTLAGHVRDVTDDRPIAGARVAVRASATAEPGTAAPLAEGRTGSDGSFRIAAAFPARVDVTAVADGYLATTLRDLDPGGGPLVVRLLPAPIEAAGQEMTISEDRRPRVDPSPTLSSHRVEAGVVDRTPGSMEDVTRALTLKPGIVPVSDYAPVLYIRGGDVYQTYFFLDDVLVFNPFQPVGGGTIFNADLLEEASVYTGGQLASFPEALSGIIAIRYKEPRSDRLHAMAEASLISVNTRLEGGRPAGEGAARLLPDGWLLSARRSDYEPILFLLGRSGGDDPVAAPYFLDLFARGTWRIGARDTVGVNGLYVRNRLSEFAIDDPEKGIEDEIGFDDRQLLGWIRWTRVIGGSALLKTSLSRVDDRLRASSVGTDPLAVDVDALNDSLRLDLVSAPERGTAWDAGLYLNRAFFRLAGRMADVRRLQPGVAFGGDPNLPLTDLFPERGFHVAGLYGQYKRSIGRLTLQPGARLTWTDATHEWNVGPRLNASYALGERHSLKAACGLFHQPPLNPVLLDPDFGNPDLRAERATHLVAGYEGEPLGERGPWIQIEGYYKKIFDQILPEDFGSVDFDRPSLDDLEKLDRPFKNAARTEAWGAELSLRHEVGRGGRVELNYSFLEVETFNPLIDDPADRHFPPYQDQRHTGNLVGSFRPNDRWTFSATGRFGSGKPYTPIEAFRVEPDATNDAGPRNIWVPSEMGPLNDARYPPYLRLDLRAERTWQRPQYRVTAFLEVLNAQLRRNTEFVAYTAGDPDGQPPTPPARRDVLGLPTLPYAGVRLEY